MTTIDHLLRFDSEAGAIAALPQFYFTSADESGWDGSRVLPGQKVVTDDAVYGPPDPVTGIPPLVTPEQYLDGDKFFLTVSLDHQDAILQGLAGNACRLIADRDAANAGGPTFLLYRAPDLTDAEFASVKRIEPEFAGSHYPFGGV